MEIISRKEAAKQGLKYYFAGNICKNGHLAKRTIKSGNCYECQLLRQRLTPRTKEAKIKERVRQQKYRQDPVRYSKFILYQIEKIANKNQIPKWYKDEEQKIINLYAQCRKLNELYGSKLEVDHIIPLRSKTVSGLHCFANLQILDSSLNTSKFNRYEQDQ